MPTAHHHFRSRARAVALVAAAAPLLGVLVPAPAQGAPADDAIKVSDGPGAQPGSDAADDLGGVEVRDESGRSAGGLLGGERV